MATTTDLRQENLIVTKAGGKPFDQAKGGEASSLRRRNEITTRLINTLADNPARHGAATVAAGGVRRLVRLHPVGQAQRHGHVSWPEMRCEGEVGPDGSGGAEFATAADPLIVDDMDRDILSVIAAAPMRQLELARRCGIASLTVKRRVGRLIDAGTVSVGAERRFYISRAGVTALGGAAAPKPVEPWLRVEAISAAGARDVQERIEHRPNDDRTNAMKSQHGTRAAQGSLAASWTCPAIVESVFKFTRPASRTEAG